MFKVSLYYHIVTYDKCVLCTSEFKDKMPTVLYFYKLLMGNNNCNQLGWLLTSYFVYNNKIVTIIHIAYSYM